MNFELGDQIGKGSTGVVYYAKQIGLDRDLAVKYIHPALVSDEDSINRLLKEASLSAKLNHPNIVRVLDAGRDEGGRPYIVMEYLEGESLQDRLRRGKLSDKVTTEIAKQVFAGLGAAHAQGAIHRDLKPSNVFLTSSGFAKILDFGIAKALGTSQTTGVGMQIGTPEYMSPELAEGNKVDSRGDLYSLGIMLYEMLTGAVPFTAESPMGVLYKHVHERLPDLPKGTELKLHSTIICLLRKSPKQRIQSATQGLEMLEGAPKTKGKPPMPTPDQGPMTVFSQPASGRPGTDIVTPEGVVKSGRPARRFPIFAVLAAVVVIVGAAVFIGKGGASSVEDFIGARAGLNLGLRVTTGQSFHVARQQALTLGPYQIQASDVGIYTVKSIRNAPLEVVWSTKRDKSAIEIGKWKKTLSGASTSTSTWPNKPNTKDSGWALSPLTLDATKLHNGEGGSTKSGLQWRLESTEQDGDRKVARIAFSNLPSGNILLEPSYVSAIASRIKTLKNDDDWSFPTTGWKTTRIEDKIDTSTGIPSSIEVEQTHGGGFKFKTTITMTPANK